MKRMLAATACALALPASALAATRSYEPGPFEAVAVAAGIEADIRLGPTRNVVVEGASGSLDDVRVSVEGKVLRIDRAPGSWFTKLFSWSEPGWRAHVVTPVLRSLTASSGAEVRVEGGPEGDFSVRSSSGSAIHIPQLRGAAVKAATSSGSNLRLGGSCSSLDARASSGSELNAKDMACENVTVHASSGSNVSVAATARVEGKASSGSSVNVRGRPAVVQVERSSGAGLAVRE